MKIPIATTAAAFLTLATLGTPNARANQNGDVIYNVSVADPNATLTDNIYFYTDASGNTSGNIPDVSGNANVYDVGNPFDVQALKCGLFGIDNISAGGATNLSVYVGFSTTATAPINQSFTVFFAPFFNQHPDLTLSETTIVNALQNPNLLDADKSDDNGQVLYQFRDYVIGLADSPTATAADINTGLLTLVHFSNGTAFGESSGGQMPPAQVPPVPEPSTWAAVLAGTGSLVLALRRRNKGRPTV